MGPEPGRAEICTMEHYHRGLRIGQNHSSFALDTLALVHERAWLEVFPDE